MQLGLSLEKLEEALVQLKEEVGPQGDVALVTKDGFPLWISTPDQGRANRTALLGFSLTALAERVLEELSRGFWEYTVVTAAEGAVLLLRAGNEAVLLVATDDPSGQERLLEASRGCTRALVQFL